MEYGLNTNQEKFNSEITQIASSIRNEFGLEIDRAKFISEFCNNFENKLIQGGIFTKWK